MSIGSLDLGSHNREETVTQLCLLTIAGPIREERSGEGVRVAGQLRELGSADLVRAKSGVGYRISGNDPGRATAKASENHVLSLSLHPAAGEGRKGGSVDTHTSLTPSPRQRPKWGSARCCSKQAPSLRPPSDMHSAPSCP